MSLIESIVEDLHRLPEEKREEVARFVEGLAEEKTGATGETLAQKQDRILRQTYGALTEEEGLQWEKALAEVRQIDPA